MKTDSSFLRVIIPIFLLSLIVFTLAALDTSRGVYNDKTKTLLCVTVQDLDGLPVGGATVTVIETNQKFTTDKQGKTAFIPLKKTAPNGENWFTVTLTVKAEGFVDTVLFDCVVYDDASRMVAIRIYPFDGSPLPYVAYTETPPDAYIRRILTE